jgi:hypothetical protein
LLLFRSERAWHGVRPDLWDCLDMCRSVENEASTAPQYQLFQNGMDTEPAMLKLECLWRQDENARSVPL